MGGWNLYLRERRDRRNSDGGWGWTWRLSNELHKELQTLFTRLGLGEIVHGDSEWGAVHKFALKYPKGLRLLWDCNLSGDPVSRAAEIGP